MTGRLTSVMNRSLLISVALVLTVFIAYWPAVSNQFVNYDDDLYVTENPHVRGGLTWEGVGWAFTSLGYAANWHPLTWLSHMVDVELFGLNPRAHHLVNIGLHAVNAVLLFLVLRGLTGAVWRSALVATLFAVHTLHVESVAWVAERKDVLSTLFWLLATAAYGWYVRQQSLGRYCAVLGPFALGLMAKPMLVTLPCVFLLLDYWPLGRVQLLPCASQPGKAAHRPNTPPQKNGWGDWLSLILEKLPLFVLSALSAVLTWMAHHPREGVWYALPFWDRIANAFVAYVAYLWKTVWPVHLAAFYPHPGGGLPAGRVLAAYLAYLFLAAVSLLVFWHRHRRPYLVTGWFWYLGTLVPVIGLVKVGEQAMADRYTYIPLIGIFILVAWSLPASVLDNPWRKRATVGASALLLTGLMALTWVQTTYWRDDRALWGHALAVTRDNWMAHGSLGLLYVRLGYDDEAIVHYREALRLQPDHPHLNYNLGVMLLTNGKLEEARKYFLQTIRVEPENWMAYNNLGIVFNKQGNPGEALKYFQEAARQQPDFADAHFNSGSVLVRMGSLGEAAAEYRTALRLNPDHKLAQSALLEITEIMKRNPDIR